MIRYWGLVTLGASAVPLFGDVLAAAFNPPSSGSGAIQVASTTRYFQGDRITIAHGGATQQTVLVQGIVDATHLTVTADSGVPLKVQGNGAVVVLTNACYEIGIQSAAGGTGDQWLGTDSTVTNAGAGSAIWLLAKTAAGSQPNSKVFDSWQGSNPDNTNALWIVGTATDKYVAYFKTN